MELFVGWHEWGRAEAELGQLVPAAPAARVSEAVGFARWYAAWQRDFADLA